MSNCQLIRKDLETRSERGELAIADWNAFKDEVHSIYTDIQSTEITGSVASYIPQLSKQRPDAFAVSVCSVDGQCLSFGDTDEKFCVQSVSKPFTYCQAIEEHGVQKVHNYVGRESSGRGFNELW